MLLHGALAIAGICALLQVAPAVAEEPPALPEAPDSIESPESPESNGPVEPSQPEAPAESLPEDPCRPYGNAGGVSLDGVRAGLEWQACVTARWFDGLFGDTYENLDAYRQSSGRAGVALEWDELDDFTLDGRLRVKLVLPRMSQRVNAVIGREDPASFVGGADDVITFLPGSFSDDAGAQWYAGINYLARGGARSIVDYGAGVRLRTPPNPYVRARYRYIQPLGDSVLLLPRVIAFWENEDGFGLTFAADTDWSIDLRWLLRWTNTLTFSEATEGVRWRSRLSLYQALDHRSAMRYDASIQGQTDGVSPDRRDLRVTYRRATFREWLFLEVGTSLFWTDGVQPRDRCNACLGGTVGFEIMFGRRYDRSLQQRAPPEG